MSLVRPIIQTLDSPYVPPKIRPGDLDARGMLLPADVVTKIKQALETGKLSIPEKQEGMRVTANQLKALGIDSEYNIVVTRQGDSFKVSAIYTGVRYGTELGSGASGTAKLRQDQDTGEFDVLKVQASKSEQQARALNQEAEFLRQAGSLTDITYIPQTPAKQGKYGTARAFIMPLVRGSEIGDISGLKPIESMQMITGFLDHLDSLHKIGIVHCDISHNNVIYDPITGQTRVIDFGLAMKMKDGVAKGVYRGSVYYVDPAMGNVYYGVIDRRTPDAERQKLRAQQLEYTAKTDTYSAAILIARQLGMVKTIKTAKGYPYFALDPGAKSILPEPLRQRAIEYLQRMTAQNHDERPSLTDAKAFFSVLMRELRDIPGNSLNTGIIDLAEYAKLNPQDRQAFVSSLVNFDRIQLICASAEMTGETARLRLELQAHGLPVLPAIVYGSENTQDLIRHVNEQAGGAIRNNYTWITSRKEAAEIPKIEVPHHVIDRHISEVVIQALPKKFDPNDLHPNGLLVSTKAYADILKKLNSGELKVNENGVVKITKSALKKAGINSSYSVIVKRDGDKYEIYAIYRGEKRGKQLGKGATGGVKLVQRCSDGMLMGYKTQRSEFGAEIDNLKKMGQHELDLSYEPQTQAGKEKYKRQGTAIAYGMIMPLAAGSPTDALTTQVSTQETLMPMFLEMLKEVRQVHARGIVHRDIKPNNFLYDQDNNVAKIIDFGSGITMNADGTVKSFREGTGYYFPGEFTDMPATGRVMLRNLGFYKMEKITAIGPDDSFEFRSNTKIEDLDARKAARDFMNRMISDNPGMVPSAADIEKFYKDMQVYQPKLTDKLFEELRSNPKELGIKMADLLKLLHVSEQERIVRPDDLEYKDNPYIKDEIARAAVLSFVSRMTSGNINDCPSYKELEQFYRENRQHVTIWQNNPLHLERLTADLTYSAKTDIYSLGISFAELAGLIKEGSNYYYVASKDDPEFQGNTKIADVGLRLKVLNFLTRMTSPTPDERPDMNEVQTFFQNVTRELLHKQAKHVGIVDIKELMSASAEEKQHLLSQLKNYSEVVLINSGGQVITLQAQKIMLELSQQGIKVRSGVIQGDASASMLAAEVPKSNHYKDAPNPVKFSLQTRHGVKAISESSLSVSHTSFVTFHATKREEQPHVAPATPKVK